jgi:hypothetical protein
MDFHLRCREGRSEGEAKGGSGGAHQWSQREGRGRVCDGW